MTARSDPSAPPDPAAAPAGRRGRASSAGAGPGAADPVTLRGARRVAGADVVVRAASPVVEGVTAHARPDAEPVDSSRTAPGDVPAPRRRAAAA